MRMIAALAALLVGCSENRVLVSDASEAGADEPASPGPSETEAEADAAVESSATTDGTCNALAQRGEDFGVFETQAAMPDPKGGEIEDGIYVATRGTQFGSTGREGRRVGRGHATTMEFAGGEVHLVTYGDTTTDVERASGLVRAAGVELVLEAKCVHPSDPTAAGLPSGRSPYTFENGTLRLYSTRGVPAEITYVKRN